MPNLPERVDTWRPLKILKNTGETDKGNFDRQRTHCCKSKKGYGDPLFSIYFMISKIISRLYNIT